MKRIFLLILIVTVVLCFTACGYKTDRSDPTLDATCTETPSTNETTPTITTSPTEETKVPTLDVTEPNATSPTIATEPSGGVVDSPITTQKTLLTFTLGEHQFYFGVPLAEMLAHYPLSNDYYDINASVEGKGTRSIRINAGNDQFVDVGVYNDSNEPMPLLDCAIWSISIDATDIEFFFTPTDQSIDFSMEQEDIKSILGSKYITKDYDKITYNAWLWTRSAEQRLITIGVAFSKLTGEIEYIHLARETLLWN